jgi:hypothetical protein
LLIWTHIGGPPLLHVCQTTSENGRLAFLTMASPIFLVQDQILGSPAPTRGEAIQYHTVHSTVCNHSTEINNLRSEKQGLHKLELQFKLKAIAHKDCAMHVANIIHAVQETLYMYMWVTLFC